MIGFKKFLTEHELLLCGGNVKIGDVAAAPIDVTSSKRSSVRDDVHGMLSDLHDSFHKEHGVHLFGKDKAALKTGSAYSGSTEHLMGTKVSDQEFAKEKPSVGDIDCKVSSEHFDKLNTHLKPGSVFGKYTVVGTKKSGAEAHTLMRHNETGHVHQVDFEKSAYEGDHPSKFDQFAHSSDWDDHKAGMKGAHHKILLGSIGLTHHKFSTLYGLKSRTDDSEPWENDTKKITSTLFGKDADPAKLHSFHGLHELISKHIPKEHHQSIYDKFKTDLSRVKHIDHSKALAKLATLPGVTHP